MLILPRTIRRRLRTTGGFGHVPDRGGDRHHAHAPGRERYHEEGEHAERERDQEASSTYCTCRPASASSAPNACAIKRPTIPYATIAPRIALRGGDQVVRRALEREHLDEVGRGACRSRARSRARGARPRASRR